MHFYVIDKDYLTDYLLVNGGVELSIFATKTEILFIILYVDGKPEYCNEFDLRKPLERYYISGQNIDCISLQDSPNLSSFRDRCSTFLAQLPRYS